MDMKEFMIATDMTTSGSLDEKLRWTFKIYDEDGSGKTLQVTREIATFDIDINFPFSIVKWNT